MTSAPRRHFGDRIVAGTLPEFDENFSSITRSGNVWSQQGAKLVGTGGAGASQEGTSVALSADGNTASVGGPRDSVDTGAAWVFTRSNGAWTRQGNGRRRVDFADTHSRTRRG